MICDKCKRGAMVFQALAESPDITFLRCPECGHFVVGFDPAPGGPTAAAYESATMAWRFQKELCESYRDTLERMLKIVNERAPFLAPDVRAMRDLLTEALVKPRTVLEAKARERG
jgi:hypothetical protein